MRQVGYGKGYRYDHDEGGHAAGQHFLPAALEGARWYEPTALGFEKTLSERIEWWRRHKEAAHSDT
jgi:putative ATPase